MSDQDNNSKSSKTKKTIFIILLIISIIVFLVLTFMALGRGLRGVAFFMGCICVFLLIMLVIICM